MCVFVVCSVYVCVWWYGLCECKPTTAKHSIRANRQPHMGTISGTCPKQLVNMLTLVFREDAVTDLVCNLGHTTHTVGDEDGTVLILSELFERIEILSHEEEL